MSGSGISLHCHLPTGNCGLNATLDVPSHTAVDLNTGGGNMQVSGIQGNVTLDSSGGDVGISGIGGTADVLTGGGNLTASDLGGVLNFTTSGGDVDGSGLFSPHVTTGSGGGNVTLVFTTVPDYVKVGSSGGDITIVVPRGSTSYAIKSNAERRRLPRHGADQRRVPPHDPGGQRRRQHQHHRSQLTRPPGQLTRSELRKVATFWVPRLAGTET